jgi:uncharacterized ferritin-like protein (DUF455 family)
VNAPAGEPRALSAAILRTAEPNEKVRLSLAMAEAWTAGRLARDFSIAVGVPERPERPSRPALRPPRDMARRKVGGSPEKRAAMLHALAHIELNAIDLAHDMIARFDHPELPPDFARDWIKVAAEEASHFSMLCDRLLELGVVYGDFPAHDGLWQAAIETRHDVLARIAIVPLVLEARGLDVTPATIEAFAAMGDEGSAGILAAILRDEIAHVAIGMRWFLHVASRRALAPADTWRDLVARRWSAQASLQPRGSGSRRDAGSVLPRAVRLADGPGPPCDGPGPR